MLAAPAVYSKHNIITIPFTYTNTRIIQESSSSSNNNKELRERKGKMSEDMFVSLSACPSVHLYVCIFVCMSKRRRRGRRVGEKSIHTICVPIFSLCQNAGMSVFCHSFHKNNKKIKIHHILKCYSSLSHTQLIALF